MKTLWFGAAAAAALLSAAAPASASDLRPLHIFSAAPAAEAGGAVDVSQAQRMGPWGFDRTGMNAAVRPGEDFFNHVNGAYVDALVIPSDRSRYGTFDALNELSVNRMRAVLDASAAGAAASGDEALIGTFYKSFMDKAAVDAKGAAPLSDDLAQIRAATSKEDLARLMGETMKGFGGSIFSAYVYDDAKNPERYTVYLGQAGIGMPDRDYYLTETFAPQKAQYEAYVAELLTLAGWPR